MKIKIHCLVITLISLLLRNSVNILIFRATKFYTHFSSSKSVIRLIFHPLLSHQLII